eukprot:NODE_175_length_3357_cov_28.028448_g152_i0.p1 GENE.NODE_175_length_3357_cov_28.028448_g152_i0~~NODE_175_length_3357_cov_28.028448_g152_i0.p1  ORF type:complete len:483 (+),score=76.87 NODE_175_length_3357_cov_28.028448_g152_i0:1249-2697(+)
MGAYDSILRVAKDDPWNGNEYFWSVHPDENYEDIKSLSGKSTILTTYSPYEFKTTIYRRFDNSEKTISYKELQSVWSSNFKVLSERFGPPVRPFPLPKINIRTDVDITLPLFKSIKIRASGVAEIKWIPRKLSSWIIRAVAITKPNPKVGMGFGVKQVEISSKTQYIRLTANVPHSVHVGDKFKCGCTVVSTTNEIVTIQIELEPSTLPALKIIGNKSKTIIVKEDTTVDVFFDCECIGTGSNKMIFTSEHQHFVKKEKTTRESITIYATAIPEEWGSPGQSQIAILGIGARYQIIGYTSIYCLDIQIFNSIELDIRSSGWTPSSNYLVSLIIPYLYTEHQVERYRYYLSDSEQFNMKSIQILNERTFDDFGLLENPYHHLRSFQTNIFALFVWNQVKRFGFNSPLNGMKYKEITNSLFEKWVNAIWMDILKIHQQFGNFDWDKLVDAYFVLGSNSKPTFDNTYDVSYKTLFSHIHQFLIKV